MARHFLRLLLTLGLVVSPQMLRAQAGALDPDVAQGIKLVDDGDYDGAILTLDNAARRLAAIPGKTAELSQAYLYLGIAYVGKGHEAAAKAKFREALAGIKDLSLSPEKFPPKVIDLFEAARQEAAKAPAAAPPPTAKPKGGSKKWLLIGGGAVVVGGGVALAAGGGSGSSGPTDNRTVETFTGTLCGDETCDQSRGYDIVVTTSGILEATATWTNPAMLFTIILMDGDWRDVAWSNRVSNTSSTMTYSVTPQTGCPTCAYHLSISRQDNGGAGDFNLTVRHP